MITAITNKLAVLEVRPTIEPPYLTNRLFAISEGTVNINLNSVSEMDLR